MTRTQTTAADKILSSHGCTLVPAVNRQHAVQVLGRFQLGFPQDDRRIEAAKAACKDAGLPSWTWLS